MTDRTMVALPIALLAAAACGGPRPVEEPAGGPEPPAGGAMTLTSPDFDDGQPIPAKHAYEGEGENVPPRLEWSNLPEGTAELALIVEDPDAPTPEPWVHDVLYKIPVDATAEEMVLRGTAVDSVARFFQGLNSWHEAAWGGPKPPHGKAHRYVFTLYALDAELDVAPGLTKEDLLDAMAGHVLATATLVGTYRR
jgi:Raf kinase inhibitor-like YbhB/YbcL family protein